MVIFGAGVVTGGLLVLHSDRDRDSRAPRPAQRVAGPGMSAGVMRLEFLRRAQRELNLSPEQRQRIDAILKESQERSKAILQPLEPQLHEELRRTRGEFRGVLTPEQSARFDELIKRTQRPHEQRPPTAPRERQPEKPAAGN